jgi:hypothetical protein
MMAMVGGFFCSTTAPIISGAWFVAALQAMS